jgi:predicted transcriptional regulator
MDKLSKQERVALVAIWKAEKGSIHEVLECHEDPKPHKNTLTSTLKNLEKKELISHRQVGNSYEYFPLVSRNAYVKNDYKNFLNNFFDNSVANLLSFIAKDKKLSEEEVEKIKDIINKK